MNEDELVEVSLKVDPKIIKETLSRLGIPNKREKVLYPSCYLYEKDDKNYIVHFKRLFLLTREDAYDNICEEDILRRNAIIYCLSQWNLIDVDESKIDPHNKFIFVLPHKEKQNWKIRHKFKESKMNREDVGGQETEEKEES